MALRLGVVAITLMVLALGAAPAAAKTFVVDDNGAQCPQADFHRIQPAVRASGHNDEIRVCDGTYREQVVVPIAKRNLHLTSVNPFGAHLRAPTAGLKLHTLTPVAIVVSRASGFVFRGFRVEGELPLADKGDCDNHLHAGGIAVPQGSARIAASSIRGTVITDCGGGGFGSGVHTGDANGDFCCEGGSSRFLRVVVDHSTIADTGSGVIAEGGGEVMVSNSVLTGRGPDRSDGGVVSFDRFGVNVATRVENNRISGWDQGVTMGFLSFDSRIVGNRIEDNGLAGILLQDVTGGLVRANRLFRNGRGIFAPEGATAEFRILGNTVRDSASIGLDMEGGSMVLRDNTSLRSGDLDCFDLEDGEVTWINNVGATAVPREICRPPRG